MIWRLLKKLLPARRRTYSEEERCIYAYWDGQRLLRVDPKALWKQLMSIWPELSVDLLVARSPSKDAAKASATADAKLQKLFSVKPLDEGGLTETELRSLLDHFWDYCDATRDSVKDELDVVDLVGGFQNFFGFGRPTYSTFFAMWLNRKRLEYRRAKPIAYGTGLAMGSMKATKEYCEAVTDGEGEAIALKSAYDAMQRARSE